MQDRFKFRVWNKAANKFEEKCIVYNDGRLCIVHNNGRAYVNGNPNYVLMQCTGLKDKNGKLIYEGDILIQKEENGSPTKKLVIWEEDGGYLGLKDLKKSFFGVVTFHRFGYTYEVIGNIYENPELLEYNK